MFSHRSALIIEQPSSPESQSQHRGHELSDRAGVSDTRNEPQSRHSRRVSAQFEEKQVIMTTAEKTHIYLFVITLIYDFTV